MKKPMATRNRDRFTRADFYGGLSFIFMLAAIVLVLALFEVI